jgi:shikimate kinase
MSTRRNIVLIGPMGSGKTTIGRQLAKSLRMDFADSDQEIERRTGAAIPLIFELEGEEGFRRREAQAIAELCARENLVLATGGGAVLREENRRCLRGCGTVVYLHASVETQFQRTRKSRHRPLLQDPDPRAKLETLMRDREPLYRQEADLVVEADGRQAFTVAREIITKLGLAD